MPVPSYLKTGVCNVQGLQIHFLLQSEIAQALWRVAVVAVALVWLRSRSAVALSMQDSQIHNAHDTSVIHVTSKY
jgi:hypothetical protein